MHLQDFYLARRRIAPMIRRTPLVAAPDLSARVGAEVRCKLETLQQTGSFKVRGAANALLQLSPEERKTGVLAFSTGNHGRAISWVGHQLGIPARICLSRRVPAYRVEAMRKLGGIVVQEGESQDEALEVAHRLQREEGLPLVSPFDDERVIAGQGTIGLELAEDWPELEAVLIPLSGGGLTSGIALVLKALQPSLRVVGVSLEVSAPMHASLQAGKPVEIEEVDSLGDALLGGIGLDNRYTFAVCRDLVDEVVLVSEEDLARGMAYAFHEHRLVVEGAGIAGLSALLSGKYDPRGRPTAVLLSGSNVDTAALARIALAHPADSFA